MTLLPKYIGQSLVFLDMFLKKPKIIAIYQFFVKKKTLAPCKLSQKSRDFGEVHSAL